MKLILDVLLTMIAWGAGEARRHRGMALDVANTTEVKFRMNAGQPGDVTRTHPAAIYPQKLSADAPVGAILKNDGANGVAPFGLADQSDANAAFAWGALVRSFPTQQTSGGMTSSFGTATAPSGSVQDVLRGGSIMGVLNDITAAPKMGDPVFIWCAATAGAHVQGGIEAVFSAGNTVKLANVQFAGPGDPAGNVELIVSFGKQL